MSQTFACLVFFYRVGVLLVFGFSEFFSSFFFFFSRENLSLFLFFFLVCCGFLLLMIEPGANSKQFAKLVTELDEHRSCCCSSGSLQLMLNLLFEIHTACRSYPCIPDEATPQI